MLHSLQSYNFLRMSSSNYLLFECNKPDVRIIAVEQQFTRKDLFDNEISYFTKLYKIKLQTATLREILFMQSLYV
jgi:hypothetical protein